MPADEPGDAAVGVPAASSNIVSDGSSVAPPIPFAPAAPTDGRDVGDWRTRYVEAAARRQIALEGLYLLVVIAIIVAALLAMALQWPRPQVGISPARWQSLAPYADAWFGGALGGALFSGKWLIHTVGRGTWNQDRLPWRLFTPWLGAGAGFVVVLLSASRVVPLFDSGFVHTGAGATGISLLIGFFADRTFSRLEGFAAAHLRAGAAGKPNESA